MFISIFLATKETTYTDDTKLTGQNLNYRSRDLGEIVVNFISFLEI